MNSFLEFLLCIFIAWIVYRFLRMAVADGMRDALRDVIEDDEPREPKPFFHRER